MKTANVYLTVAMFHGSHSGVAVEVIGKDSGIRLLRVELSLDEAAKCILGHQITPATAELCPDSSFALIGSTREIEWHEIPALDGHRIDRRDHRAIAEAIESAMESGALALDDDWRPDIGSFINSQTRKGPNGIPMVPFFRFVPPMTATDSAAPAADDPETTGTPPE